MILPKGKVKGMARLTVKAESEEAARIKAKEFGIEEYEVREIISENKG